MNFFTSLNPNIFSSLQFQSKIKIIILLFIFLFGCSTSKRFYNENNSELNLNSIRVLLYEKPDSFEIVVGSKVNLFDESKLVAKIYSGNKLEFLLDSESIKVIINNQEYLSDSFFIKSADDEVLDINNKKYRGIVKIFLKDSQLKFVNQLSLEDYVKGVMTKEMPIGNGNENYNALKAFSICVRTYAYNKLLKNKNYFDIYSDTRDQVYGGIDGETEKTNSIVDETKGQLLFFGDEPAIVFYHSTCGGYTEDVQNVFTKTKIPYLVSVEDGDEHYCKVSPRYEWKEYYPEEVIVERLYNAELIFTKNYKLSDVEIKSRFNSGRVNELMFTLLENGNEEKVVLLVGNSIRSTIRSSDGKSILRSNYFNIDVDENKNVSINGKGNGHGVGLCQWGAIGQSRIGKKYIEILNHYFPGTNVKSIYD